MARFGALALNGELVRIEGQSMEPRLTAGDYVLVVPVPWEKLRRGDMIKFRVARHIQEQAGSQPTWVHEVVYRKGDWVQTMGINNAGGDPFQVHRSDYLGAVAAVYCKLGEERF